MKTLTVNDINLKIMGQDSTWGKNSCSLFSEKNNFNQSPSKHLAPKWNQIITAGYPDTCPQTRIWKLRTQNYTRTPFKLWMYLIWFHFHFFYCLICWNWCQMSRWWDSCVTNTNSVTQVNNWSHLDLHLTIIFIHMMTFQKVLLHQTSK